VKQGFLDVRRQGVRYFFLRFLRRFFSPGFFFLRWGNPETLTRSEIVCRGKRGTLTALGGKVVAMEGPC
jgi:hypothetical protein